MPPSAQPRVLLVCAASVAVLCAALSATQSQVARERPAGLAVDFVAVRADGTPVADLQTADIEIRLNGRIRAVRSLRRVATAQTAPARGQRIPPPFGTNDSVESGRSFVLVIDEESLIAGQMPLIKNAVEGLLSGLTASDQAAVVSLPFTGVKTAFTSDTARVRLAVAAVAGRGSRNETGSELACRTRRFLESFDAYLQQHAGRSTPMTVVLFTAGLAAPRRDAAMAEAPGMCELLVNHFQRITMAAGAARANLYVAHPDEMGTAAQRWRESIGGTGYLGSDNPLEGIENIAGVTGGMRLPLDATGTASLSRTARESSAYYVAEIEPAPDDASSRSRPLAIRTLKRDVTIRSRPDITFIEPVPGGRVTRLALPELLLSRDAFTEVRLRAAGFTVRESDGRLRVGVVVEPADDATPLTAVGAVLRRDSGDVVARWNAGDTAGRPLLGAMAAPAGTYRLRVVAIDTAGGVGAAEDVVDVGLTIVGPLSLGSLLLGISRQDTFVPQLQFAAEPTAIASFDIYGGTAGMRMTAVVEIARDAAGPAMVTLPLALTRADEGRVIAKGAVPVGALPPGDYIVRGVIRLEDGTTGQVTRTLRKISR